MQDFNVSGPESRQIVGKSDIILSFTNAMSRVGLNIVSRDLQGKKFLLLARKGKLAWVPTWMDIKQFIFLA